MAHDLMARGDGSGEAAMFYVGKAPWHGLGTRLERPPASSAEAIAAAGLDWEVAKVPLYVAGGHRLHEVTNRFAIVRPEFLQDDECPVFGIVSRQYEPLQNREAFAFFDAIVEGGDAEYHTAGALGIGERIWVLAKLAGVIRVAPEDEVQKFLLLTSTHDGTGAVRVLFTPVRVVCQNTLSQAVGGGGGISVPHTRDLFEGLEQARRVMRQAIARYREMEEAFQRMAAYRMDQARLAGYLRAVFPDPPAREDELPGRAAALAAERRWWAGVLFEQGAGNDRAQVRGTLWAAYNGVTELVDHGAGRVAGRLGRRPDDKGTPRLLQPAYAARGLAGWSRDERRLQSAWFGEGARLKALAYDEAVTLVR